MAPWFDPAPVIPNSSVSHASAVITGTFTDVNFVDTPAWDTDSDNTTRRLPDADAVVTTSSSPTVTDQPNPTSWFFNQLSRLLNAAGLPTTNNTSLPDTTGAEVLR